VAKRKLGGDEGKEATLHWFEEKVLRKGRK